jgi:hypothetical protein
MEVMAKKPKKTGRARDRGDTRLVTIELDAALDDAIEAFRQQDRRTKKTVITMALEEFLTKHGVWPPPKPPPPP